MVKKRASVPNSLMPWIEARRRFHLSHAHVQMAFELGMNPKTFGKLANHHQERWKLPLPDFIAHLYVKHFGKTRPDHVRTVEQSAVAKLARKQAKKQARQARKAINAAGMAAMEEPEGASTPDNS
jgi:hypothetical protein